MENGCAHTAKLLALVCSETEFRWRIASSQCQLCLKILKKKE